MTGLYVARKHICWVCMGICKKQTFNNFAIILIYFIKIYRSPTMNTNKILKCIIVIFNYTIITFPLASKFPRFLRLYILIYTFLHIPYTFIYFLYYYFIYFYIHCRKLTKTVPRKTHICNYF